MQLKFPWKQIEIHVPRLQDVMIMQTPPPVQEKRFSFVPPSKQKVYETTVLFQQKLYETFSFDHCDTCSKKVTGKTDLIKKKLNDPALQILKQSFASADIPTLLCPSSLQNYHIHHFRFCDDDFAPYVMICKICMGSLIQGRIPKFGIQNFFFVEHQPQELQNLTIAEKLVIAKVYKRSVIWQCGQKQHSSLNQHILTFDNDLNNFTTILPRPISQLNSLLKIVFLKDTEEEQFLPKVGMIRKDIVMKSLYWLKEHNQFYYDVEIDEQKLSIDEIHIGTEVGTSKNDLMNIFPEHVNFQISPESYRVKLSNGTYVERTYSSGLYQVQTTTEEIRNFTVKGALNNWIKNASDGLLGQFYNTKLLDIYGDLSWIPMSYPVIFPLGKTGPGAMRLIKVSFEEWVNHLLQIKSPRFREHYDFPLFMFNISQRRQVSKSCRYFLITRLMLRSYPSNLITKDILQEQLLRLKDKKALTNPDIIRLLQSTRHTGALVSFSPFRKSILRANIFATIAEKGWPAFFVTLNPNDVSSPFVKMQNQKQYSKSNLFKLFSEMSSSNINNEDWCKFATGPNGADPVSCAKYFHSIVKIFIEVFLGFDFETKSFTASTFGQVTNFFGVVEEQQRKQLHIHMLIWVDGLEDYEVVHNSLLNNDYRKQILEYLDLVVSSNTPSIDTPDSNPGVWQCPELTTSNIDTEYWKQFRWVQSWVQGHTCSRYYCMKKHKKCRFNFPKALVSQSSYNEHTRKLDLKRSDGYVNTAFPPVSIVGRFNNDIKFIPGSEKPQVARYYAYYISNYTSKQEATNLHLVDFMSRKISDYEKYKPDILEKSNDIFHGLLFKTLNKFSASHNVGSVTAASSLLGYQDHYCGSEYTMINWKGWDIWLCKALGKKYRLHTYTRLPTHTAYYRVLGFGLSSDAAIQDESPLVSFDQEYLARNAELDNYSIYELQAEYQFMIQLRENLTDDYLECTTLINQNSSPYVFCHKKRNRRAIPSLPGFNTKSKIHGVGTEAFGRLMLVLFKPFKSVNTLWSDTDHNYCCYLKTFLGSLPHLDKSKKIIEHFTKDAEVAIEAANREHSDNPLDPALFYQQTDSGTIKWQAIRYHLSDPEGDAVIFNIDDEDLIPKTSHQEVHSTFLEQVDADKHRIVSNEENRQTNQSTLLKSGQYWKDQINQYLKSQKTSKTCKYQWACIKIFARHVLDTLVGSKPPPLRMFVHGEGGTGKSFVINTIVGLLEHLKMKEKVCVCAPTGKAAVNVRGDTIDGLFGLSRGGNGTGYGNTANTSETPIYDASPLHVALYLILDEISMVGREKLADMHDKLGQNVGEEFADHILGNKSFIFFGDFIQFPPVGRTCIISKNTFPTDENGTPIISPQNRKNKIGTMIFHSINHFIELIEQKRQDDPEYLAVLRAIRNMVVTDEHVEYLRTHCSFGSYENHHSEWLVDTPFVVSTNREKVKWNNKLVQTYSEVYDKNIVKVQSIDWVQRDASNPESNPDLNKIDLHNLQNTIIDGCLQYELSLVLGMTLVVLENLHKQLGVVNGTEVILEKIHYDNQMSPIALEVKVPNQNFRIGILPPSTVWIQRKKTTHSFLKLDGNRVQVQRIQFPVTEGFAATAHKKQGSTLKRAVICLENGKGVSSYVKLSRTKRASDTYIMGSINLSNLQIKPPSGWVLFRKHLETKMKSTMAFAELISDIEDFEIQ